LQRNRIVIHIALWSHFRAIVWLDYVDNEYVYSPTNGTDKYNIQLVIHNTDSGQKYEK